jgi:hypothetical protein
VEGGPASDEQAVFLVRKPSEVLSDALAELRVEILPGAFYGFLELVGVHGSPW